MTCAIEGSCFHPGMVSSLILSETVFYVAQIHTELLRVCEQRSAEY